MYDDGSSLIATLIVVILSVAFVVCLVIVVVNCVKSNGHENNKNPQLLSGTLSGENLVDSSIIEIFAPVP